MPLAIAPIGKQMKIMKVVSDDKSKRHLENLGILVGGEITVVSATGGNIVIKIKEGRIALNRGLATKIFVA